MILQDDLNAPKFAVSAGTSVCYKVQSSGFKMKFLRGWAISPCQSISKASLRPFQKMVYKSTNYEKPGRLRL